MPNIVKNKLIIIGNLYDRLKFIGKVYGGFDIPICFSNIYPKPEKEGYYEPFKTTDWTTTNENSFIDYNTGWRPAFLFITEASKQFPELKFYHEYLCEGGVYIGYETIQCGVQETSASYNFSLTSSDNDDLKIFKSKFKNWMGEDDDSE